MSRKDEAYHYLKEMILSGEMPPETQIREMEISAKLNMSRTPIREAMRELETEGLIVSYPARGSFVLSLTPYDVEEIYALRVLHETWALEKGFERYQEEELERVQKAFDLAFQKKDWVANHESDRMLHGLIIEKAGSRRLAAFVKMLNTQIDQIRYASSIGSMQRLEISYQEHTEIISRIRSRDLGRAKEALQNHLFTVAKYAIDQARMSKVTLL
ncbi:GntR family transcriptional regulator [Anaerotruncus rubiinfantis]|uniref:GntR family transcriptional regulator n=1 Tax=Anaerotruncus rubiinfantis TaxID=1720200 RepID=UPI0011CBD867|nr:GntR family transcriptional regulator [Anaerotruncus rubiinfantis]